MVAGKKRAGAVVALLTASYYPTLSFVAPSTSVTTTHRAWSPSDNTHNHRSLDKRRRCSCPLAATSTPVQGEQREEAEPNLERWRERSSSGRPVRHRDGRRRRISRLWGGKNGKMSSSLRPDEISGDHRRINGGAGGVPQGSEALEGKGTSTTQRPASEGVLGAAAPVTSSGEVGGGNDKDRLEWSEVGTECQKRVYICTNRWCMEKGSSATLGSFVGLAPEGEVLVQGVNCLGRCNKGPNVRVRQEDGNWLEFNRIENVERVYKILRDYLGADVSKEAALCLKYNFLANAALDRNEVTLAIDYYDKAIATGYADQQGVLLVMRATAFIQRAYSHGRALSDLLQKVVVDMPTQTTLEVLHELWEASGPSARMVLLGKFAQDCEGRGSLYQKTKFRYGLYEFALLRACEDALRATETLPNYPKCWLKAGDALAALRKPKEAAGYYQVALDLDASMESYLKPKIAALQEGNGEDALASIAGF